ncbi:MAG: hypothetical protein ABIJ45_04260 [Candidatus Zixiibacteriota bacterium]
MKWAGIIFFCIFFFLSATIIADDSGIESIRQYYIYNAPSRQFIEPIDSAVASARARLITIIGDTLDYLPRIVIKDNIADFKSLIGSAFPDWGAAAALPYRQLIALKSPAHFKLGKPLAELVQHEYTHLVTHYRLRPSYPPRWLDEGLSMYIAYEWGWDGNFAMSRAAAFNSLIPLGEIEMLNRFSSGKAQTAYAQSYLGVKYFLDVYGIESFNIFLDTLRVTRSSDSAFMAAVGGTTVEFEKEFFEYVNKRYNIMSLFGDLYFLWIILAAVVFFGALLKFIRRKKYYDRWEEEDKLQSRDFDYGDPNNPEQVDDEDKPWL